MIRLRVPSIVISIPRLAAYIALAGIVAGGMLDANPSGSQSLSQQPAANHKEVLSTPAPTVTPSVKPSTGTSTTPQPDLASIVPHSGKLAPVITPAAGANVSSLKPVDPTSTGSGGSSSSTPPEADSYTSTNWSGYLTGVQSNSYAYTGISGSWTVPKATGAANVMSADATWIGIGGVSPSKDLIQVGTNNIVSSGGQETSAAFYELLPDSAQTITSLTITPGDNISASLAQTTTGNWTITITDTTTGQTYTATVAYNSSLSSAEWIEEDPSYADDVDKRVPLDVFDSVSFTGGTTTANGSTLAIASSSAQPITLITDNQQSAPIATPSALGSDGESFKVLENSAE